MTTRKHCTSPLAAALVLLSAQTAHARGPWRADEANTRGWQLMTPEERIAHQARVRSFTDYGSCEAYRAQHHALMTERALQRGLSLNEGGHDFCDRLKPSGPD